MKSRRVEAAKTLSALSVIAALAAACTATEPDTQSVPETPPSPANDIAEFLGASSQALEVTLASYTPAVGRTEGYAVVSAAIRSGALFNQIDIRLSDSTLKAHPDVWSALQNGQAQTILMKPRELEFAARRKLDASPRSAPLRPVLTPEATEILRGSQLVEPFCGAQTLEAMGGVRIGGASSESAMFRFSSPRLVDEQEVDPGAIRPKVDVGGGKFQMTWDSSCSWTNITYTWACRRGFASNVAEKATCNESVCGEDLSCTISGALTRDQLIKLGCEVKKDSGTPPTWSCNGGWEYKEGSSVTVKNGRVEGKCSAVQVSENGGGIWGDVAVWSCQCEVPNAEKTDFNNRCKKWQDAAGAPGGGK